MCSRNRLPNARYAHPRRRLIGRHQSRQASSHQNRKLETLSDKIYNQFPPNPEQDAQHREKEMTMADDSEQFISSHEKANNGYGQNGDPSPSSVLPGKKAPKISGNVAPPDASADPGDWQTRKLSPDNVPDHPAMKSRTVSDGSPGGILGSNPARPVKR
jgi:hypothetical protein